MRNFLKHVTVEPSFFIYILLFNWTVGFNENLFLQKSCRHNSTIEPDLSTKCDDEKAGVLFISEVNSKYHFVESLLIGFITMFSATWSDKAGRRRRPLIYMPILGQVFVSITGCLHSYFWHWRPTGAALSSAIFYGFSGGTFLMGVACQIYLCEGDDSENHTMKLGILRAIQSICMILGKGGSGIILRRIGFFYSHLMCLVLAFMSLIFALIFIKDNSVPVEKEFRFCEIFNVKRTLFDNFKVVFNKNLGSKRVVVSLLILARVAVDFTFFGEVSVLYPYLRYRFGIDEQKYSIYSFYRFSLATLGALFCSIVLSKCLKIHDGLLGILAGSFDLVAITALMFATQIWQIYMAAVFDLFHGCVVALSVSFTSKYYKANELGRLQAVTSAFSTVFPFTFPAYNAIFQATLDVFPSSFCFLSIVIDFGIIICFCVSYSFSKKIAARKPTNVEEETHKMMAG